MAGEARPRDEFVQSLARGLSVIAAFDADHPSMTLSEVAAQTSLSRAAARRFLHTLVELGYVHTDGRLFALTPQVLRLGTSYLSGLGLPAIAQPHLERLSAAVGESTSAAVLDGHDIVYVARAATRRIMSVGITVGTRFPAYATSMGRVLLASLDPGDLESYLSAVEMTPLTERTIGDASSLRDEIETVRQQGWCVVDQELEAGLRSIAVPVNRGGQAVAAINVSTSVATSDGTSLTGQHLEPMLATAASIGADLDASLLFG